MDENVVFCEKGIHEVLFVAEIVSLVSKEFVGTEQFPWVAQGPKAISIESIDTGTVGSNIGLPCWWHIRLQILLL